MKFRDLWAKLCTKYYRISIRANDDTAELEYTVTVRNTEYDTIKKYFNLEVSSAFIVNVDTLCVILKCKEITIFGK